jgi:hypothetical protein
MDITNKTIEELKVLAYDQMVVFEQTKANLSLISQEIEKKTKEIEDAKL